jgi:hypothetical protein
MAPNEKPDEKPTTTATIRLVARVLRTLVAEQKFETYADLKDALKTRLARLRIPASPDDVAAALDLVESNTPAVDLSARRVEPLHASAIRWDFR